MQIPNAQLAKKGIKRLLAQSFGENVSQLRRGRYMFGTDIVSKNFIVDKMTINFDMLCAFMENWVGSNM